MTFSTLILRLNALTTTARDLLFQTPTTSESPSETIWLSAEEVFRQGWGELLEGQTRPIKELWEELDAE